MVSNASGNYVKERLLPGMYEVKAELTGFKAAIVSRAKVSLDSQTNIDMHMELGELTEAVTVTAAEGQLLKTDRADVSVTFETKQLTELPILDRNFTKFVLLTPGTQRLSWNHATSENPQGSIQTMVNGQHFSGTGFQLDGTENRDPILGIIVINPTLESIGESKITSQNYDAEFGQATAGVVSVQTKSGTNNFHGSAFEFHQTDKFQARNPFSQPDVENPLTGRVLPETKRDQFGASIHGPIQQNKWFFFGDYQGWRYTDGGSKLLTVPTPLARTGDLSEYGINIFDPESGATPADREQFSGNVIPGNRLSPEALAILDLLPLPNNGTDIINNYIASGSEKFDSNAFNTRIDGRLSDRLNLFGRYSFAKFAKTGPSAFDTGGGPGIVDLGGNTKVKNQSLALGVDYTLSSTSILDFRFGWFRYQVDVLPNDFGTTPATDAGIPGMNLDAFSSGLPGGFINNRLQAHLPARQQACRRISVRDLPVLWLRAGISVVRESKRAGWQDRQRDCHAQGHASTRNWSTSSAAITIRWLADPEPMTIRQAPRRCSRRRACWRSHPMPATIVFASFTGEEAGLLGSREFVRRAVEGKTQIVGALNNDMIGWANDQRLDNTIRYSNPGIRDIQHGAAMLFTKLITYDALYFKSTDAAAYYDAYGDIVGGIGSYPVLSNPHYHQSHDFLEFINHQLIAETSKTTVATLMLLASSPSRLKDLEG